MKSRRTAAVMYLIAALLFLITGVLGFVSGSGARGTFIVLSVAFLILAFNFWPSTDASDDR